MASAAAPVLGVDPGPEEALCILEAGDRRLDGRHHAKAFGGCGGARGAEVPHRPTLPVLDPDHAFQTLAAAALAKIPVIGHAQHRKARGGWMAHAGVGDGGGGRGGDCHGGVHASRAAGGHARLAEAGQRRGVLAPGAAGRFAGGVAQEVRGIRPFAGADGRVRQAAGRVI